MDTYYITHTHRNGSYQLNFKHNYRNPKPRDRNYNLLLGLAGRMEPVLGYHRRLLGLFIHTHTLQTLAAINQQIGDQFPLERRYIHGSGHIGSRARRGHRAPPLVALHITSVRVGVVLELGGLSVDQNAPNPQILGV